MPTSNIEHRTSNIEVTEPLGGSVFTSVLDVRCSMFDVCIFFALILSFAGAVFAAPTTAPTTAVMQPSAANLEYREWAVFVVDAATGKMNPQGIVTSTLPGFVTDHRFDSSAPADAAPVVANNGLVFNGRFWIRLNQLPAAPASNTPQLADSDLPSPVGVIRLTGSADTKVDVSITSHGGDFLGSWPKAEDRDKQLLWRDLSPTDQATALPPLVAVTHWFTELRSVHSAYLSSDKLVGNDRFLLYDLETAYPSPLKARGVGDFKFEITNPTTAPLHDLTLYQGDHDGWRSVSVGELNATAPPRPATIPTTAPVVIHTRDRLGISESEISKDPQQAKNFGYTGTTGLFVQQVRPNSPAAGALKEADIIISVNGNEAKIDNDLMSQLSGTSLKLKVFRAGKTIDVAITLPALPAAATAPSTAPVLAATKPATAPSVATTAPAARTVQLTISPSTQPSDFAESWKPIMTTAGIDPTDQKVITRVIARYAFDPHRLTAVYRMDDAEFDRLLPIEVVPQPAVLKRFALVIVLNVDPAAGTIVDDLIKQLGDDDWSRRDAAYHALSTLGPAAAPKLIGAKNSTDLEVAWRAERLLAQLPNGGK